MGQTVSQPADRFSVSSASRDGGVDAVDEVAHSRSDKKRRSEAQSHHQQTVNRATESLEMDQPNPFATIDKFGLEVWPDAARGIKMTEKEKQEFREVLWYALYDVTAQCQWAERFFDGRIRMAKTCSKCTKLGISCKRGPRATCQYCHEHRQPGLRCQHLERYYVDYASRRLSIDLSVSMARFHIAGGPTRKRPGKAGRQKQTTGPVPYPVNTRRNGIVRQGTVQRAMSSVPITPLLPDGGVLGANRRSSRVQQSRMRGVAAQNVQSFELAESNLSISTNGRTSKSGQPSQPAARPPSPSPSVIEIIPVMDAPGPNQRFRNLVARDGVPKTAPTIVADAHRDVGLNHLAERALEQRLKANEDQRHSLQKQYQELRSVSQTFFHEVADAQSVMEVSLGPASEARELVKTLTEQQKYLRAASLKYRQGLWAIDKELQASP